VLVSKRNELPAASLNGMAHLDAVERPATHTEPVVRTKGGTAHGLFEVTEDISQLCRADFLQPGTRTPVFYIDDPRKVVDFVRSRRTRIADNNTRWDFWTSYPESAHQVTILMTDRGIPRAWAKDPDFHVRGLRTAANSVPGIGPALAYWSTVDVDLGARAVL
jgi:catalase